MYMWVIPSSGSRAGLDFEAAAARIIIDAHLALEKHVLTRWQLHWKEQIGQWYGMFVHEAQYLEPVMRDLESFLESSQKNVTGEVSIRLRPYSFSVTGVDSPYRSDECFLCLLRGDEPGLDSRRGQWIYPDPGKSAEDLVCGKWNR